MNKHSYLVIVISLMSVAGLLLGAPGNAAAAGGSGGGSVEPYYGSFSTEVPIGVPAFHGLEPPIKLAYSSAGRNGFVGVGWVLNGPSVIERAGPGGGAPRFDSSDVFYLDGMQLIPDTSMGGTHSLEVKSYQRIKRDTGANKWYVWATNGMKVTYTAFNITGRTDFRWLMTEVRDTRGNAVAYTYWCDGMNECYLDNIAYNGTEIKFYREKRLDVMTYATGAGLARINYRLSSIAVRVSGSLARAYNLTYTAGGTGQSLLSHVQQFGSDATYSGYYELRARHSGKCLDVAAFGTADGTNVQQWTCYGFDNQLFKLQPAGSYWNLVAKHSNKCVDVAGFGTADGTNIQQWTCNATDNQAFQLQASGVADYFKVVAKHSGKCLDVYAFGMDDGSNVNQWTCYDYDNQLFTLVPTGWSVTGGTSLPAMTMGYQNVPGGFLNDGAWISGAYGNWDDNAKHIRAMDVNGDGKSDIVIGPDGGGAWFVLRSTGSAFVNDGAWISGAYGNWDDNGNSSRIRAMDVSGDGKGEIVIGPDGGGAWYVLRPQPGVSDLLTSLTNGVGGSTTIQYTPSSAWTNTYMPEGMIVQTVSAVTTSDGRGNTGTTSYQYEGGLWSWTDRRFLGFRKVKGVVDAQGNYTETYYRQKVGSISKPDTTYFRDVNGNIFSYSQMYYTENTSAPYTSLLTERWDYECNLSANCRRVVTQLAYDQYGNAIETREWGDYDVSGDERTTTRGYYPNTTAYIAGLPAYENIYAGIGTNGTLLKQQLNIYDSNSAYNQAPTVGNLAKARNWNNQTNGYVESSITYDAWGNVTRAVDELGHASTSTFDSTYHKFPTQVCDALNRCSGRTWDVVLGEPLIETNPNGTQIQYTHDALGRLVTRQDGSGAITTYAYLDTGNPNAQRVRISHSDGSADGLWVESYQDGLGRVYKTLSEGGYTKETVYSDVTERVWKQSQTYKPGETVLWALLTYDGAGRQRTMTSPDGSYAEMVYANDANGKPYTVSYDELRNEKVTWGDAYGNVTQVREKNGSSYYYTTYQYNVLGDLVRVVDHAGHVSTITWDSLGRKLSTSDPDMGVATYSYDAVGNLLSQTDAKGQTSSYTYDALGRIKTRTAGGQTTTWYYDEAGYGVSVGQLTRIVAPGYSEKHWWDANGNETKVEVCIGDTCQQQAYAPQPAGGGGKGVACLRPAMPQARAEAAQPGQPGILLVNDVADPGASYVAYYADALSALGKSFETWTVSSQGSPSASTLQGYSIVIWLTGDDYGSTLQSADISALSAYLDGGGKLFISGQDIGYDISTAAFYANYLHASFVEDDTDDFDLAGADFLAGVNITISGGDGADNQQYPSEISPVNGAYGIFDYSGSSTWGGLAYSGAYKLVYFSFGFEAINSAASRNAVMNAVISWLDGGAPQPTATPGATATKTATPGATATKTATPVQPTATPGGTAATLPFFDGFESGTLAGYWSTYTTSNGRVQVSSSYPHAGSHSTLLDCSTSGTSSYAGLILTLSLAGQSGVGLNFWWREFSDENHAGDGVFISDDGGASWCQVMSFNNGPSSFRNDIIDLDAKSAACGMSYSNNFKVKFQYYDNYAIPSDGYAIDDVQVSAGTSATPTPAPTSVPPTATSSSPTATPVQPTATSSSPTATPVPPTATPVPPTPPRSRHARHVQDLRQPGALEHADLPGWGSGDV